MKGESDVDTASLFGILRGERPAYVFPGHDYDRYGNMMGPFSCMLNMSDYKGKMGGGLVNAYKVLMAVEGTPS